MRITSANPRTRQLIIEGMNTAQRVEAVTLLNNIGCKFGGNTKGSIFTIGFHDDVSYKKGLNKLQTYINNLNK